MSIWTSSSGFTLLPLALILPLAACVGEGTGEEGMGSHSPPDAATPVADFSLPEASLFRGEVVVAGPAGYCVDRQSLKRGGGTAFALIASCEILSGKAGTRVPPAVMTVSVSPRRIGAKQPSADDLAASMAPAKALKLDDGDGISIVQMASGGDTMLPDGDPRHWRAGMLINGHVVSLAVYGAKGSAAGNKQGRTLLMALAETLREKSPVKDYSVVTVIDTDDSDVATKSTTTILGGLFPDFD